MLRNGAKPSAVKSQLPADFKWLICSRFILLVASQLRLSTRGPVSVRVPARVLAPKLPAPNTESTERCRGRPRDLGSRASVAVHQGKCSWGSGRKVK